MTTSAPSCPRALRTLFLAVLFVFTWLGVSAAEAKRTFDIPAGKAETTLREFADKSGTQFFFSADKVSGIKTNAVKGDFTPSEALDTMLTNTPLVAVRDEKTGAYTIRKEVSVELAEKNGASRPTSSRTAGKDEVKDGTVVLDTFEVFGRKTLNMDIRRTADDALPAVVFDRERIERSGAPNLEEFLKGQLTMVSSAASSAQDPTSSAGATLGNGSQIGLRGLGASQTLILIDGHRVSGININGTPYQPDINGIPLAAVERIEVLPTSASAMYGGGATAGAINIILRRDYVGFELTTTYDNTFSTDAARRTIGLSGGFTFNHGRSSVIFSGSYNDGNDLLVRDRPFTARAEELALANFPAGILDRNPPWLGATTNIHSVGTQSSLSNSLVVYVNAPVLTLKSTGASLGSSRTFVPYGYAGVSSDGGAALIANAGKQNLDQANTSQGGNRALVATPTVASGMLTLRHEFSPRFQAFVEAAASTNNARAVANTAPTSYTLGVAAAANPFNQQIRITVPGVGADSEITTRLGDQRVVAGLIFKLPSDWKAETDFTWNQKRFARTAPSAFFTTTTAAVQSGVLDVFKDINQYPISFAPYTAPKGFTSPTKSTLRDYTARAGGSLLQLPAGPVTLSSLYEHRDESYSEALNYNYTSGLTLISLVPELSQSTDSVYAEVNIPLLASPGKFGKLDLNVAARGDWYSVNGANPLFGVGSIPAGPAERARNTRSSVNPMISFRYQPAKAVAIRGSYGTGFQPANVSQLVQSIPTGPTDISFYSLVDPKRGNEAVTSVFDVSGGNPRLKPETSTSWSGGLIFTPQSLSGFRFSIDWTRIEKQDNITTIFLSQATLALEDVIPGMVTRAAPVAGDPFPAGKILAIDESNRNISRLVSESYDFALNYTVPEKAYGSLEFFVAATRFVHLQTQIVPTLPLVENMGAESAMLDVFNVGGGLKWKANAGVTWKRGPWTVNWLARYFDSYWLNVDHTVDMLQGSARVPSQTYHDLAIAYRFGSANSKRRFGKLLADTEVRLGIQNIFNHIPPVDFPGAGARVTSNPVPVAFSQWGDPRLASYRLTLKKSF